jgi:tRNA pseudouridine55 synthase
VVRLNEHAPKEAAVPSGILVIDKPRGPTSHDVVFRLRRVLRVRQVGHAGTLDPMATGVLVVAIGEATKLVSWLTAADKGYEATVALGVETDTLDAEGREVRRAPPDPELLSALSGPGGPAACAAYPPIRAALERERARTTQVPPVYSAIRTDGERAFARARRGEAPVMVPRPVQVAALELVACSAVPPQLGITARVSKGFYVRALARDLAEALSTVGHLTQLRRTSSGCFTADEAVPLDAPADELRRRIQPLAGAAARALPVATLTDEGARDARFGRAVSSADIQAPAIAARVPCAWVDPGQTLVAVGHIDDAGIGHVLRGFCAGAP